MNRYQAATITSIVGLIGNVFLLVIKSIIGFISHSQAMIADAFNSASDIINSILAYVGNKISSQESDEDHNLGHGKAEYIYSLLISIIMGYLGIKMLYNSIISIHHPEKYIYSNWLVIVCIVTIITKLCLYIFSNRIGKKYKNLLITAHSKDHRNDVVITIFNMISAILSLYGMKWLDGIVGVGISLWIIYTAIVIYIDSYDVLMDKTCDEETKDKVMKIIKKHKEIKKINHFNATPVGYQYQVSFSIFVDGNMSTYDSHNIADNLEKEIKEKVPNIYLSVIHVNPYIEEENTKQIV